MYSVVSNPFFAWIVGFPLLGALLNGVLLPWIGKLLPARVREDLLSRPTVHLISVLSVLFSFILTVGGALYLWRGPGAWVIGVHLLLAAGCIALLFWAVSWVSRTDRIPGRLRLHATLGTTLGGLAAWGVLAAVLPRFLAARYGVSDAPPPHEILSRLWTWIPMSETTTGVWGFGDAAVAAAGAVVPINFSLDRLSALMSLVVTGVGFLIHVYSMGYMGHDRSYRRFFTYLNLFVFFMLVLVLADNLVLMFVGWEGVGLCSYLLIGFWFDKDANAVAGKKAFIVNRIGDFGFLLAIFLIASSLGTVVFRGYYAMDGTWVTGMSEVIAQQGAGAFAPSVFGVSGAFLVCLLLFVGAAGKSAQIPLYVWLPDAMAGPTPVSALIHAATMVTAGVYMIARLGFLFSLSPTAMAVIATLGAVTALFAAVIGVAQNDIKKVLAYSTISQLGYMFVAVGVGAFTAGVFHLFTHAFFKACLFLGAGAVIHAMAERQDIREMGGLRKALPVVHWTFLAATLAIAGFPPFAGFFSKDEILWTAFSGTAITRSALVPAVWPVVLWFLATLAAGLTAFYMFRLYFLVFWGESRAPAELRPHLAPVPSRGPLSFLWNDPHTPVSMRWVLILLGAASALAGLLGIPHLFHLPNLFARWLSPVLLPFRGEGSTLMEWILLAGSVLVAALGASLAWIFYRAWPPEPARALVAALPRTYRLVADKFRIDELYGWVVVRPLRFLAFVCTEVVDRFLSDTVLVGGTAWLVRGTGRLFCRLQSGTLQRYAAVMAVGLAGLLLFVARPFSTIPLLEKPIPFAVADGQDPADGATLLRFLLPGAPYRYEIDADDDGLPDLELDPRLAFGPHRLREGDTLPLCLAPGEYLLAVTARSGFGLQRTLELPLEVAGPVRCRPLPLSADPPPPAEPGAPQGGAR